MARHAKNFLHDTPCHFPTSCVIVFLVDTVANLKEDDMNKINKNKVKKQLCIMIACLQIFSLTLLLGDLSTDGGFVAITPTNITKGEKIGK